MLPPHPHLWSLYDGWVVGLGDPVGLFQPWWFYDFMCFMPVAFWGWEPTRQSDKAGEPSSPHFIAMWSSIWDTGCWKVLWFKWPLHQTYPSTLRADFRSGVRVSAEPPPQMYMAESSVKIVTLFFMGKILSTATLQENKKKLSFTASQFVGRNGTI